MKQFWRLLMIVENSLIIIKEGFGTCFCFVSLIVGITGGAAAQIHGIIKQNIEQYSYLKEVIDKLGEERDCNKLVDLIKGIVKDQQINLKRCNN